MSINPPPFRFARVSLGSETPEIPVADIQGQSPGKTLLITGGSDGDEYVGMEAAYQLVAEFSSGNFAGRLIIIPILNVPGFNAGCSQNPLDQKFVKAVFPGAAWGSATDKLVAWLTATYIRKTNVWLDLHGGAITERLHPYLWTFETGVAEADTFTARFLQTVSADFFVQERVGWLSKATRLAKFGCAYFMAESGERGERNQHDIGRHILWAKQTMALLEMIPAFEAPKADRTIFRNVSFCLAPFDGIWHPINSFPTRVKKGVELGRCVSLDGSRTQTMYAPEDGTVLWWRYVMPMQRGDVLCAAGAE